jgi:hypothetical protein
MSSTVAVIPSSRDPEDGGGPAVSAQRKRSRVEPVEMALRGRNDVVALLAPKKRQSVRESDSMQSNEETASKLVPFVPTNDGRPDNYRVAKRPLASTMHGLVARMRTQLTRSAWPRSRKPVSLL